MQPDALGAELILHGYPVFFAIYPDPRELPGVVEWQRALCRRLHTAVVRRPAQLLHVSVAECGRPNRRLRAFEDALAEAGRHFSFAAFDLVFDASARFGKGDRAFVALADTASQEHVRRLRIALADAQRAAGFVVSRGDHAAHLTLGYGDALAESGSRIESFGFRAAAVDLVASDIGRSRHIRLSRWPLG